MLHLVGERRRADALLGDALGSCAKAREVEPLHEQAGLPVALDLAEAALRQEADAVGHRFLRGRGEGSAAALGDRSRELVVERGAVTPAAEVGPHGDVHAVLGRDERPAHVIDLAIPDDAPRLLGNDAQLEVLAVVPRLVPVAPLFHGFAVIGVRRLAHRDERGIVRRRRRAHGRLRGGLQWLAKSSRRTLRGERQLGDTPAGSSSSAIWFSVDNMTRTVPKSCRWKGVIPSSRKALR